jgi:hypothetical protein
VNGVEVSGKTRAREMFWENWANQITTLFFNNIYR